MSSLVPAELDRALRANARANDLDSVLAIGDAILDSVFDGDPDRRKDRTGATTLRALARAPGVGLSPSSLSRYVAVAALCRRLGRSRFEHVGVSHLRVVATLPERLQDEVVLRAEFGRWTVRRTSREVTALVERLGFPRRGRPHGATFADALPALRAWASHPGRLASGREFHELDAEQQGRVVQFLKSVERDLATLISTLEDVTHGRVAAA